MKKLISTILVLTMILVQVPAMGVGVRNDYSGHWAEEYISKLVEEKVVSGDANGNINPDNNITRAEFVKIVNRKFGYTAKTTDNFVDVASDKWYAEEFKIAKKQGYIKGDASGKANPDSFITRAEVCVIIARVLELKGDYTPATRFTDEAKFPSWAKESIYRLNAKGYINGYPDGSFKAENTITRAESFTIISKVEIPAETITTPDSEKQESNTGNASGGGGGGAGGGGAGGGGGGAPSGGETSEPENKDRTIEELTEINNNSLPKIEMNEKGNIGLYRGIYSEKKVDDVSDAIESLENVKTVLNIEDVSEEFIPFDNEGSTIDDGVYKIQQVYNGVPVSCAQTIIGTDENGYPNSILNRYDDSIRLADINTTPTITEQRAKEIIANDLSAKSADYTNVVVDSIYLEILPEEKLLVYSGFATCDNSFGWNYTINAHTGELLSINELSSLNYSEYKPPAGRQDYEYTYNHGKADAVTIDISINGNEIVWYNNHNNHIVYYGNNKRENETNYEVFSTSVKDVVDYSYVKGDGSYSIDNFDKIVNIYKKHLGFYPKEQILTVVNLFYNNACYSPQYSKEGKYAVFQFGKSDSNVSYSHALDLAGHEYTHFVQDYFINSDSWTESKLSVSLGDKYKASERVSGNYKWVEAKAISEGTADVMGMLVEAIAGEVDIHTEEFWYQGEYSTDIEQTNSMTINHNDQATTEISHQTVDDIKLYYNEDYEMGEYRKDENGKIIVDSTGKPITFYIKGNEIPYGKGPGHAQRYIFVNALEYMVANSPEVSAEAWFEIWGNAIKLLNPNSGFVDFKLAIINSATNKGVSNSVLESIQYGLEKVGITAGLDERKEWYHDFVVKALKEGLITEARPNDSVTRAELLAMSIRRADIYTGDVESKVSHWAGSDVTWAYCQGIVDESWIENKNGYLDKPIPRWEAARVITSVLNRNHTETQVYFYPLTGTEKDYDNFIGLFSDRGKSIGIDNEKLIQLLDFDRGSKAVLKDPNDIDGIKNRMESFKNDHSWYGDYWDSTAKSCKKTTYEMLYYFGMYQLWMNGRFDGTKEGNQIKLRAFDQISRAEVCKILCCK